MKLTKIITHQRSNIKYNTRCLRINSFFPHNLLQNLFLFPWYQHLHDLESFSPYGFRVWYSSRIFEYGWFWVMCWDSPMWNLLCTSDVKVKNVKNGGGFLLIWNIHGWINFNSHLLCVGKMLFSYGWTMCRKKTNSKTTCSLRWFCVWMNF